MLLSRKKPFSNRLTDTSIDIISFQVGYQKWKDGKRNGRGTLTCANGDVYYGEWKDSKRNGQGNVTFKNGSKEICEFIDGKCITNYTRDCQICFDNYANVELCCCNKKICSSCCNNITPIIRHNNITFKYVNVY